MVYRLLKVVLICLTFFFPVSMSGEVVTQQKAMEFATRFFANHAKSRGNVVDLKLAWDSNQLSSKARSSGESPAFYVFTPSNGKGFVIVSGDDACQPVIGYSFENSITNADQLPYNLTSWLRMVHESIVAMRNKGDVASALIKQQWTASRAGNVLVMLDTPQWNQGYPYNLQCPMDGDKRSKVGCTAVAVATIMRYYEWPKKGKGVTEEYITGTKNIQVEARNLDHEYDWDKMKMDYINSSYSDAEADAVATLMADVAIAIGADFSNETTWASASPHILYRHFDYHPGMYWTSIYGWDTKAQNTLVDELLKNRPILYRGAYSDGSNGHLFVLDGCTTDNYFHVNWGWGGFYDGFFALYYLSPADRYYHYYNMILVNMYPNDGSKISNWIQAYNRGIMADTSTFLPHLPFNVNACVINNSLTNFSGTFKLAVTDSNGKIKEWISNEQTEANFGVYMYVTYNFPCVITQDISIGDRIRMFYREQNSEEWELVTAPYDSYINWEILIADEKTLGESTSVYYDKKNNILRVYFKYGASATVWFNGQLTTKGVEYDDYGYQININTKELTEGVYTIKLEKGEEKKEFTFEIKPL